MQQQGAQLLRQQGHLVTSAAQCCQRRLPAARSAGARTTAGCTAHALLREQPWPATTHTPAADSMAACGKKACRVLPSRPMAAWHASATCQVGHLQKTAVARLAGLVAFLLAQSTPTCCSRSCTATSCTSTGWSQRRNLGTSGPSPSPAANSLGLRVAAPATPAQANTDNTHSGRPAGKQSATRCQQM